jgi:hypothetical protein
VIQFGYSVPNRYLLVERGPSTNSNQIEVKIFAIPISYFSGFDQISLIELYMKKPIDVQWELIYSTSNNSYQSLVINQDIAAG